MGIFTHLTVGTNDLDRARGFYDQVLEPLGLSRTKDIEGRLSVWGHQFFVLKPANGEPACIGNGVTIGLAAPSRAAVDDFHARALAAGGTCEGPPGPRAWAPNAYAAYIRDLDGHKLLAACTQPA